MSIKVMTHIWETSKQKGSALLLLLAIADHAHDDGDGAYPTVQTLALKSRMTPRNVQVLLRHLEAEGELRIVLSAGPYGANLYQIPWGGEKISGGVKLALSEQGGEKISGVKSEVGGGEIQGTGGVKALSPKPSENHQRTIREMVDVDEPFREKMRHKYQSSLSDVDERINEALAHAAAGKWKNKQLYVQGWLRRDAERLPNNGNNRKVDPRRAHEEGASHGRPWTVIGSSPKGDNGEQAV